MLSVDDFIHKHEALPYECHKTFNDMREQKELCDIILKVGDHSVYGHKVILAAAIPYFRSSFGVLGRKEIALGEVDPSALEALIDFAYTCEVKITSGNAQLLLTAACLLQIDHVVKACVDFLSKSLSAKTALNLRELGARLECSGLLKKVDDCVKKNFDQISQSEGFIDLPYEYVKDILTADDLHVISEEKVFEAIMRWIKASPDQRSLQLPDLLSCVRMPYLKLNYLRNYVATDALVKGSLQCRDILDDAKDYHLFPEKQFDPTIQWKFSSAPRQFAKKKNITFRSKVEKSAHPGSFSSGKPGQEDPVPNKGASKFLVLSSGGVRFSSMGKATPQRILDNDFPRTQQQEAVQTKTGNSQEVEQSKFSGDNSRFGFSELFREPEAKTGQPEAKTGQPETSVVFQKDELTYTKKNAAGQNWENNFWFDLDPMIYGEHKARNFKDFVENQFQKYVWNNSGAAKSQQVGNASSLTVAPCKREGTSKSPAALKNYNIQLLYVKYHPSIDSSINDNLIRKCIPMSMICNSPTLQKYGQSRAESIALQNRPCAAEKLWKPAGALKNYNNINLIYVRYHPSIDSSANENLIKKYLPMSAYMKNIFVDEKWTK